MLEKQSPTVHSELECHQVRELNSSLKFNRLIKLNTSPACDAKKVRASGRGLQSKGVRVGDIADFKIHTEGAGEGTPQVTIIGPGGTQQNCEIQSVSLFNGDMFVLKHWIFFFNLQSTNQKLSSMLIN